MSTYSNSELQKVQDIETSALKEIISVCEKLSIDCFVIGGSCLGAIRHNGFIPWDDDIDVGMRRDDYDRFLREAPRLLDLRYFLQCPTSDENSPYSFSKLRVNDTLFLEYSSRTIEMHHGIFCDIFPFDEVPDDEKANLRQFKAVTRLNNLLYYRQVPDVSERPDSLIDWIRYFCRSLYHLILKIVFKRDFLLKRIEEESTRYNGTGQRAVACLNFPIRKREYILLSDLYPLKKHAFGGLQVNVPNNVDVYLTTHYGNWKQLPPYEERIGHRPLKIVF